MSAKQNEVGQAERAMGKTHSGIVAAFNLHLVKTGLIEARHGKAFPFEPNRRLVADYDVDGVDASAAAEAIASAQSFVAAIGDLIERTG